jgi:hypothetical protein
MRRDIITAHRASRLATTNTVTRAATTKEITIQVKGQVAITTSVTVVRVARTITTIRMEAATAMTMVQTAMILMIPMAEEIQAEETGNGNSGLKNGARFSWAFFLFFRKVLPGNWC